MPSESSEKKYLSKIGILKNKYEVSDLNDYGDVMEKIKKLAENTIKLFIISIIWWDKNYTTNIKTGKYQKLDDKVLEKYGKRMKEISEKNNKSDKSGLMNGNQKEKMIPWKEIIDIRDRINKEKPNSLESVIVSLYSMVPPRRLDYANFVWIDEYDHDDFDEDDDTNYCVFTGKKMYFIFNSFKTVATEGVLSYDAPKSLMKIILGYVNKNKIKSGKLLLGISQETNLSTKIKSIFEKYSEGSGFSCQLLRHMFCSYVYINNPKFGFDKWEKISQLMSHSHRTHMLYSKHMDMSKHQDERFLDVIDEILSIKIHK